MEGVVVSSSTSVSSISDLPLRVKIRNFTKNTSAMTVQSRKYKLLQRIEAVEDESMIHHLEDVLDQLLAEGKTLAALNTPMREHLDIDELIREQNYKHPTKEELDKIMQEADIQEPIEVLLNMI